MNVVITHKVKRMLKRLAVCPECGAPAKLIVDPSGMIGWSCGLCLKNQEEMAALDGLKNMGRITPEQAEAAKRRIAEGGEAGKLIAKSAEPIRCPKCGWKAGEA